MQILKDYINREHKGSQVLFAKANGVHKAQVTQWLKKKFIVVEGVLYSPRRELKKQNITRSYTETNRKQYLFISMKPTDTETLIKALRILSVDIQTDDGVASSVIAQAAYRLEELERNEYICKKCGLRKNDTHEKPGF